MSVVCMRNGEPDRLPEQRQSKKEVAARLGRVSIKEEPPNRPAPEQAAEPPRRFVVKQTGDDAKNYDFARERSERKTTNVFESIGSLAKSCLGGGVVAIHESYMQFGLISGVIINALLGVFMAYCMMIMINCAQILYGRLKHPEMSYPDLAEAALATGPFPKLRKFDKVFRYAVDLAIGIDLFGACCVYSVVIARTIRELMEVFQILTPDTNLPIRVYLLIMLPFLMAITMIRTFKYLAPFAIVGDIFLVTIAVTVVYYAIERNPASPLTYPTFKSLGGFLEFLGVCVFSMEGYGCVLTVENHMREPKKFYLVLIGGMSCVCGIVMTVGFFGYWGWDTEAKSPITLNLPWTPFAIFLKSFMAINMYITFAINFWLPFNLVWVYLKNRHNSKSYWFWERVYRAIFVLIIVGSALIFPDVSSLLGLLGALCVSNMGFIFPATIQLLVEWEDPGLGVAKWRLFRFALMVIFGIFLIIMGTFVNVRNLINKMSAHNQ